MIYINHRINTIAALKKVPTSNGVELDIRYHEDELILDHDPFSHQKKNPQKLKDYLENWAHLGPMILNIKTEGVEKRCIDLMNEYDIKDWFFLDLSMPYFVLYSKIANDKSLKGFTSKNLAVRFSEYEPIEYALSFKDKVKWVWVDCFTHLPLNDNIYKVLKEAGFSICLVSPELQKHSMHEIIEFKQKINKMDIDAVCTKRPDLWGQELEIDIINQLKQDFPVL